jgi:hypothetical protein
MSMNELKSRLNEYIQQYSIANFDADDIIELVSGGESIDWIVNQLRGGTPIDTDAVTSLLTEIQGQLKPETEPALNDVEESAVEPGAPELSQADPSSVDLSQISDMLPKGVQLPPGLGSKELKSLLESPQGKIMEDFLVFCQEKGVDLSGGSLNRSSVKRLQEEWLSTPRDGFGGKSPSEMLSQVQGKVETFRRQDTRVGRNDPCPCGSGKKYKKCCGKNQ